MRGLDDHQHHTDQRPDGCVDHGDHGRGGGDARGGTPTAGALDEYGVVVLPELNISDDDLAALSQLGEVVLPPYGALADHPEISPVTHDPAQDKFARYREANVNWHMDRRDQRCTRQDDAAHRAPHGLKMAKATPSSPIRTRRTERCPSSAKALIDGLRIHWPTAPTRSMPNPSEKAVAQWATVPKSEHPLVWKRQDGRRSLVMGSTAEAVIDMPDDEGQALLRRLLDWATQPEFTLSHSWREGDLVIFDRDTGLLHRAMPYSATSPRLMHRATIAGDEAFGWRRARTAAGQAARRQLGGPLTVRIPFVFA